MESFKELKVNPLPVPTWHWLKVNDADIKVPDEGVISANESIIRSDKLRTGTSFTEDEFRSLESGMGREFSEYGYKVSANTVSLSNDDPKRPEEVIINISYKDGRSYFNSYRIEAKDNCDLTVIMRYNKACDSNPSSGFRAGTDTRVFVGKNAKVTLVQVEEAENAEICNNIASYIEDNGSFDVIQLVLCGKKMYNGIATNLMGRKSRHTINTGYVGLPDSKLDFNYVARHNGVECSTDMYVNGVLHKKSEKCLRATVDFITGSKGAKGAEKEDVLLLDDNVINKTVPLILCTEEDVEGEHGATIGKLSDEILFYLNTRGIDKDIAYKLLAAGRILTVARMIENEEIRNDLISKIDAE